MSTATTTTPVAISSPRIGAPGTLTRLFFDAVERHDRPTAMLVKVEGRYEGVSHRALAERVRHAAMGLAALGVQRGERVAILSETRLEWAITDYACLTGGMPDVPVYPTVPAEQVQYILGDAGVAAIFVATAEHAATVASVREALPTLRHVIGFGATRWPGVDITLEALEARGAATESDAATAAYRASALEVTPQDVATIIYTSGTTGVPKGVVLTHDNLFSNVQAVTNAIPFTRADVSLSFLPLSHVLERMFDFLMFSCGVTIAYVESMDTILQNMSEVRPTIVVAVPRVYEKIYSRVMEMARRGSAVTRGIFAWASAVGDRWATAMLAGTQPDRSLGLRYALAQRLVFSKIRKRVGGRLRYFVSGGAPLAPEIGRFFYAAGLPILEGYGLTETSPVIAVNTPTHIRIGTVGQPIAGVEVTIAPDGEILTRGPNVMRGYLNQPAITAEAIDSEGWFHTGDIGALEDGFLRITDRKKNLIVTSGGKNIAPQPIEGLVVMNPFVSQAVMIGDRRKFPVILVVPEFTRLESWAAQQGLDSADRRALLGLPAVRTKMETEVRSALAGLAHYETPRKVGLLEHELTVERGELSPKLEVKRHVIAQRYANEIEALYTS
ncbi:MAG TPA: long-chain fatty acid--CoA ligase [Gemmatimonadaceae bacterium]|nr:long-chain fatty acid--CoA ligase [Gemmatimonadaceae bacterium]